MWAIEIVIEAWTRSGNAERNTHTHTHTKP
jgi:hypothetical protein